MSPEFQDPPPVPNYPPYLVFSDPYRDTTVTAPQEGAMPIEMRVTVADPNLNDHLYARWVTDYPRYVPAFTQQLGSVDTVLPPTGRELTDLKLSINCANFKRGMPDHRLVVIISDRPFVPVERAQADNSDYRYNQIEGNPRYQALMVSWDIAGCQ